jgi:hypothetical protein
VGQLITVNHHFQTLQNATGLWFASHCFSWDLTTTLGDIFILEKAKGGNYRTSRVPELPVTRFKLAENTERFRAINTKTGLAIALVKKVAEKSEIINSSRKMRSDG